MRVLMHATIATALLLAVCLPLAEPAAAGGPPLPARRANRELRACLLRHGATAVTLDQRELTGAAYFTDPRDPASAEIGEAAWAIVPDRSRRFLIGLLGVERGLEGWAARAFNLCADAVTFQ